LLPVATFHAPCDAAYASASLAGRSWTVLRGDRVGLRGGPGPFGLLVIVNVGICDGCGCPSATCEAYGASKKCCPDCRHT
jgi:hypothetical protein